jgi:DNA (cytosine-5)-methyltransferase 1
MAKLFTSTVLFSGGGGVECGLLDGGFHTLQSVEFDPLDPKRSDRLAEQFKLNFPDTNLIRKSVTELEAKDLEHTDLLHASPVCSSFSKVNWGGHETDWDKQLSASVAFALGVVKPKIFTLEQVPLYSKSESWKLIKDKLEEDKYTINTRFIDSIEFDTPQYRTRFFVIASKDSTIGFPPPSYAKPWHLYQSNIEKWKEIELIDSQIESVKDFKEGIPPLLLADVPLLVHRHTQYNRPPKVSDYASLTITGSSLQYQYPYAGVFGQTVLGLDTQAIARLQGFPDWYQFSGKSTAKTSISLSVPPKILKGLSNNLRAYLLRG